MTQNNGDLSAEPRYTYSNVADAEDLRARLTADGITDEEDVRAVLDLLSEAPADFTGTAMTFVNGTEMVQVLTDAPEARYGTADENANDPGESEMTDAGYREMMIGKTVTLASGETGSITGFDEDGYMQVLLNKAEGGATDDEVTVLEEAPDDSARQYNLRETKQYASELPRTRIAVTRTDGELYNYPNASLLGIWSGKAVLNLFTQATPTETTAGMQSALFTFKTEVLELADIERLEFGYTDDEDSVTLAELYLAKIIDDDGQVRTEETRID